MKMIRYDDSERRISNFPTAAENHSKCFPISINFEMLRMGLVMFELALWRLSMGIVS